MNLSLNTMRQSQMIQQLLLTMNQYSIQYFLDVGHFYCHVRDGNGDDYVFDVVDSDDENADDDLFLYELLNDETQL